MKEDNNNDLNEKQQCSYSKCDKDEDELKAYIIADDLENPRFYHPECFEKFKLEVMLELYKNHPQ